MFTNTEKLIAIRNLRPKRKQGFLKVISLFSFLGIMLGVAILIIVMSVMNGFRTELTNKIIGLNPHIVIKTNEQSIDDIKNTIKNNFDLKLTSENGQTTAGNCDLCYLKGTKTLTKIIKEKPDLADWWIAQEKKIDATFRKNGSYIDLLDLTKLEDRQLELFDDDSRSCFCHD